MARIKYSALVENITGSIQGTTFQRNAYGYTVKGKPNMVNPNTTRQNARKRTFSAATQAWRDLSDSDRSAWEAYANAFPIPSRKNPDAYLSGLAAFTRWAGVQYQLNTSPLNNPSGPQGTATIDEVTLVLSGGSLFANILSTTTEGPWNAFLYLSRPLSASQGFIKSWQRFVRAGPEASWGDEDITAIYTSIFGFVPPLGSLIGAQAVLLNTTNGQVLFGAPGVVTVTT
jgi:hypothetical protein